MAERCCGDGLRRNRYRRHHRRRHAAGAARCSKRSSQAFPLEQLAGHFHDTYGQALANISPRCRIGVAIFDTSVAGLGGCPYAKGATGNVATEDVLYLLNGLGIATGIDLAQVVAIGDFISRSIGKPSVSRAGKALLAKKRSEQGSCV